MVIDKASFDFDSFKSQVDLILNKCNDANLNFGSSLTHINSIPTLNKLLVDAFDKIEKIKIDNKTGLVSLPFIGQFIKSSKSKIEEEQQKKKKEIEKIVEKTFNLIENIKEKSLNAQRQLINIKDDLNLSILDLKNRYIFLENIINKESDKKNIVNTKKLFALVKANINLFEENIKNINFANTCIKCNIDEINDFIEKYDNQSENNLFLKQYF